MTCIAYRNGVLAGDRLGDYGGTRVRVRKVHRIVHNGEECLIGVSGNAAAATAWIVWMKNGEHRPTVSSSDGFTALLIDTKLRVWRYEWSLVPQRMYGEFHAIGCGRGEALGAMAMGADARKAVLIASRFDIAVGYGVETVEFNGE